MAAHFCMTNPCPICQPRTATLQIVRTIPPLDEATLDEPVGAPALPTLDYFVKPADLPEDAKLTVDFETGRVFGRVAPREQCLLSRPGECWTISDSPSNYRGAMQGETLLADGTVIRTANVGGAVRHAPLGRTPNEPVFNFHEAVDWYENTASRLMRVVYGADEHGVWVAGVLMPHVTKRQALDIMASPVSGDWRWRPELDAYDMSGIVLVNMPGFPLGVKARAASAWGEPLIGTWDEVVAMVASLPAPDATVSDVADEDPAVAATFNTEQRQKLAKSGAAMKGGGFPIRNRSDLKNAIQAFGRAKDKAAAKAHIIKRAKALGLTSLLPEGWMAAKAASPGTCTCGAQTAAPDADEIEDVPEYITRADAETMVRDAVAAAVSPLAERMDSTDSVIDTLATMAAEQMDATLGVDEVVGA